MKFSYVSIFAIAIFGLFGCGGQAQEGDPTDGPMAVADSFAGEGSVAATPTSYEASEPQSRWMSEFPMLQTAFAAYGKSADALQVFGQPSSVMKANPGGLFPTSHHQYWWEWKNNYQSGGGSIRTEVRVKAAVEAGSGKVGAIDVQLDMMGKYDRYMSALPTFEEASKLLGGPFSDATIYYLKVDLAPEHRVYLKAKISGRVVVLSGPYQGTPVVASNSTDFSRGESSTSVSRSPDFSLGNARVQAFYVGPEEKPFGGAVRDPLLPSFPRSPEVLPPSATKGEGQNTERSSCPTWLSQIRSVLGAYQEKGKAFPASLTKIGVPEGMLKCSISGKDFIYDPQTGKITCQTCGG